MEFPVYQPFSSDWLTFVLFCFSLFIVMGLAELLRSRLGWTPETARKLVHVLVGVLIFWARFLFVSPYPAALLGILFTIILFVALLRGGFPGMHATNRASLGTVFYPLAFVILVLVYWHRDPAILLISFSILAFGDPLAAQMGESVSHPKLFRVWRDKKSLQGSLALGMFATLFSIGGLIILRSVAGLSIPGIGVLIVTGLSVGLVGAIAEGISRNGSDNLSLPLATALMLDICLHSEPITSLILLIWFIVAIPLTFVALRTQILTLSGALTALLLGTFIIGIGGVKWLIPLITFFLLSSLLSKAGGSKKQTVETLYEKGSNRDMMQVLANGGVAGLLTILWHYFPIDVLYYAYLGSLAAATADTWGTEIGVFSRQPPRSILTFQQVPVGTSGGVTLFGTAGALVGAVVLTLSGWIGYANGGELFFRAAGFGIISLAGLFGALFDSLLGATVQGRFLCPECGRITEKPVHCGIPLTELSTGIHWVNNDLVNLACTTSAAILVLILLS